MDSQSALILGIVMPYVGSLITLTFKRWVDKVGVLSILSSALLITYASFNTSHTSTTSHLIIMDGLSLTLALVASWLSFLIAVYSLEYMKGDPWLRKYWTFFTFFVGSMLLAVLSDNMLYMFIGWEGTGLASYALIGHWFTDEEDRWVGDPERKPLGFSMGFSPSHSGLRAIVFTRVGDVGLLAALSLIYVYSGTFSLSELAANSEWALRMASQGLLLPTLILFTLGPMAKSAQVPFHEWLITAMTGPTSVSALIHAATMVKLGIYALLRMNSVFVSLGNLEEIGPILETYGNYVMYVGVITAFFLGLMAVVARELKLILAFSTASQLGYMFAAAGSMMTCHEPGVSYFASLFHLVSHALFKATLFLAAGAVIHAVHSRFITDMGSLASFMRLTFLSFILAGASLAGIPPLSGFWSKDMVLESLRENTLAYYLSFIAALVTAFYTFRMITKVFLIRRRDVRVHEPGPLMLIPYFILGLGSLILGVAWPWLSEKLVHFMTLGLNMHLEVELEFTQVIGTVTAVMFVSVFSIFLYLIGENIVVKVVELDSLRACYELLYDRFLLNSIYYLVFVKGLKRVANVLSELVDKTVDVTYHSFIPLVITAVARGIRKDIDDTIDSGFHLKLPSLINSIAQVLWGRGENAIDNTYHIEIPELFKSFSRATRRGQPGILNYYLLASLITMVVLVVMVSMGVIP